MASSQSSGIQEIIDTTEDHHNDDTASDENVSADEQPQATSSKKKKKKKSKAAKLLHSLKGKQQIPQEVVDRVMEEVQRSDMGGQVVTEENVRQALEEMKIMDVAQGKAGLGGINRKNMGKHKFWETQPVPQPGEGPPLEDGYIEPSKPREEVRQDPYPLPNNFEWSTIDIDDPVQNKELYDLLSANYVEDDDASFRFQYTAEFLHWALHSPGYHKDWHIGVRVSSNKKLVAFISGVPITLRARRSVFSAAEINFLCVHKKLRSKRLAPVLIKEVTRQVHLKGVFQAIYTAGVVIPTPVSTCRYYHRSLNIPKLVDIKFTYVPRSMTMARMIRIYQLPETPSIPLREIEERDVIQVANLYIQYMKRFDLVPVMSIEDIQHQLLSGKGSGKVGEGGKGRRVGQVTWTYVVEDPDTNRITDFFSFYYLPSTVINSDKHNTVDAVYLFYYASEIGLDDSLEAEENLGDRLRTLIGNALIVARNAQFDVFNALTMMDNSTFLETLKFGQGDGNLNFYLYNWRTAPLSGSSATDNKVGRGVGVVML